MKVFKVSCRKFCGVFLTGYYPDPIIQHLPKKPSKTYETPRIDYVSL